MSVTQVKLVQFEDYFKIPAKCFLSIGLNPYFEVKEKSTGIEKILQCICFHLSFWNYILSLLFQFINILSVAGREGMFLDLLRALSCFIFGVLGMEELLLMWFEGGKFNAFILSLETMFPTDAKTQDTYSIREHYESIVRTLKQIVFLFVFCIFIWVVGSPIVDIILCHYQNTTYVLEVPFEEFTPWKQEHAPGLQLTFLNEIGTIYSSVMIILAVNVFFMSIVAQISLQFNMLCQNIRDLPADDVEHLWGLVKMHNRLIAIGLEFTKLISRTVFVNHIISSVAICCALIQVSIAEPMEIFRFVVYLICVIIQTFNMSWIGDILIEHVKDDLPEYSLLIAVTLMSPSDFLIAELESLARCL